MAASISQAGDIFWTNPGGGNWNVATNWSGNEVPGSEDLVFITLGGTYGVTLNAGAHIAALTLGGEDGIPTFTTGSHSLRIDGPAFVRNNGVFHMNGGVLHSTSDLTIRGEFLWTGGVMTGDGRTIVAEGATLTMSGSGTKGMDGGRVLENRGTVVWSGGNIDLNSSSEGGSGRVENTGTGLIEIQSAGNSMLASAYADVNTVPLPAFISTGTVRKTTSDSFTNLSVPFTNTGTAEMQMGILNATGLVTVSPESAFRFVLAGPDLGADFGQFRVVGTLTLQGTVEFALANEFLPIGNQQFTIISAGTLVGRFSEVWGNALPDAIFLNPLYALREVIVRTQDARPILQTGVGATGSQFRISGIAGQRYRIYATSALDVARQDWLLLDTVIMPGSTMIDFVDLVALDFSQRFYAMEYVAEAP